MFLDWLIRQFQYLLKPMMKVVATPAAAAETAAAAAAAAAAATAIRDVPWICPS